MSGINISCQVLSGGQSSKVAVSSTSAQSVALTCANCLVTPDVDVFVRMGTNPTAVADGTDQILLAGNTYRIQPIIPGYKLAFVSTGSGNVYLTPDA
jgi:hypothetical protein